jgi:hypothetical protein
MTGHGAKFGRKKEEAIQALLSKRTQEEAAAAIGVTKRTLSRWLQMPEFRDAYRKARRDAFSQSSARLQQVSVAAASVLAKMMLDQNQPAAVRVRAADRILERARQSLELEDIEARLSALERAASDNGDE